MQWLEGALWFTTPQVDGPYIPLGVLTKKAWPSRYTRAQAEVVGNTVRSSLSRCMAPTGLWKLPICPSLLGILQLVDHLETWGMDPGPELPLLPEAYTSPYMDRNQEIMWRLGYGETLY